MHDSNSICRCEISTTFLWMHTSICPRIARFYYELFTVVLCDVSNAIFLISGAIQALPVILVLLFKKKKRNLHVYEIKYL